ncbi:MAG: heavy metal translocating P-type ATPase [Chitinophagaceae bacterium]
MEQVNWKVEGMTCANCALTIHKYLENQGMKQVKVNLIGGEVHFDTPENNREPALIKGLASLGYTVVHEKVAPHEKTKTPWSTYFRLFVLTSPFTLVLLLHMSPVLPHSLHFIMQPEVQLLLCAPVYGLGLYKLGRSAWTSLRNGLPNMNVLVTLGATAAFGYSLTGTLLNLGPAYQYYETAATIITLVFFGNFLEERSIATTQRALKTLARSQKLMANMIAFDGDHREVILPVENTQLRNGDLILIKSGEQVPTDSKVLWGEATLNESIITGESEPVYKTKKSALIGGSVVLDGTLKAQVTAPAKDSVLANIIDLVKKAQAEKPPIQQLADRISAIFVPVVVGLSVLTFFLNWYWLQDLTAALMRSIAVLVISCPCAMGLATPAALAVGLGRAARSGILFRNAKSLELFRNIQQVIFDKTGTLTTGQFTVKKVSLLKNDLSPEQFQQIVFSLEKYSNHPIAQCIAKANTTQQPIAWSTLEERKGIGMFAQDREGNRYVAGSYQVAKALTADGSHSVYVLKNNQLIGTIDVEDEIRPEAIEVIRYLKSHSIKTILLSGDRQQKCAQVAAILQLDEVIAEQTPEQKQHKVSELSKHVPTAMVGDGINDAPALAQATLGVAMSDAAHVALQSADVILMNNGLKHLNLSLGLGKHTYLTIRQNLFWAFAYNVVAIPAAAFGWLGTYGPTYGALFMGLSDVVLAINSVRLYTKKVV